MSLASKRCGRNRESTARPGQPNRWAVDCFALPSVLGASMNPKLPRVVAMDGEKSKADLDIGMHHCSVGGLGASRRPGTAVPLLERFLAPRQHGRTAAGGLDGERSNAVLACLWVPLLVALLATGCETLDGPPVGKDAAGSIVVSHLPPALLAGEPIVLGEPRERLLKAVAGADETIHIFLRSDGGGQPRHLMLRADKVLDGEVPPVQLTSSGTLDAVVDRQGVLRLTDGKSHLELGPNGWRPVDGPECVKFLPGGPNPVCLVRIVPSDPRQRKRWDWHALGGFGVGIIWPWRADIVKFGITELTSAGWIERGIVDRASDWDTDYADGITSPSGDVEVVYQRGMPSPFLGGERFGQWRYQRFNAPGGQAAPMPSDQIGALGPDDASWSLVGLTAKERARLAYGDERLWDSPRIASTPQGHETLILIFAGLVGSHQAVWMRRFVRGTPDPAVLLLDRISLRVRGLVALAEGHLIALLEESRTAWWSVPPQPLKLMEYRDGKWSAPIELGVTSGSDSSSLIVSGPNLVAITAVNADRRVYLRLVRVAAARRP
jgi:hypothetical protein